MGQICVKKREKKRGGGVTYRYARKLFNFLLTWGRARKKGPELNYEQGKGNSFRERSQKNTTRNTVLFASKEGGKKVSPKTNWNSQEKDRRDDCWKRNNPGRAAKKESGHKDGFDRDGKLSEMEQTSGAWRRERHQVKEEGKSPTLENLYLLFRGRRSKGKARARG